MPAFGPGQGPGSGRGPRGARAVEKPKNMKKTLGFLWGYLKKYKFLLIAALLLTVVNVLAALASTSLQQPIIDNYLHPTDAALSVADRIAGLTVGVIKIGCVLMLQVAAAFVQNRLLVKLSQRTINNIRTDLFAHLQTLPVSYYDRTTRGELMSRFTNDCDALNDALQNSVTTLFSSSITLVGILYMMFTRSVSLTLINLCAIPLLVLTVGRIMKRARVYTARRQQELGDVNGYVEEMVTGQKVVKVFEHEQKATEEFDKLNEELAGTTAKALTLSGMMMPLSRNLNNMVYACIATVGGMLAVNTGLSMGTLVVFLQLSSRFGQPINEIANQGSSVITAIAGAERICEVMEAAPEDNDGEYELAKDENGQPCWKSAEKTVPLRGDVRFNDVDFSYIPGKEVLHDLTLYAKPAQKIAFVGSTGAGKTTIINLLARFYDVTSGEILIDGIPSGNIRRKSVREAMAVVLQDTHLFTGTVRENIRYGRMDATDEEIEQAARLTHAHSFIRRLPQGYDTLLEGDGANLSQGQRQLLNITRAAVSYSPVLVLDEATSSIDTRTEKQIEKGLDSMMKNRTTYVIAHRLSTVRNSNAIMVMEDGRIIERGTHEDLLALGGRYYELYTGAKELD